jgi:hypothetical protein
MIVFQLITWICLLCIAPKLRQHIKIKYVQLAPIISIAIQCMQGGDLTTIIIVLLTKYITSIFYYVVDYDEYGNDNFLIALCLNNPLLLPLLVAGISLS